MKKLNGKEVIARIRALLPGISRITYYGPAELNQLQTQLNTTSRFVALGDKAQMTEAPHLKRQRVSQNEVWMAPYNANNTYYIGYADWGEVYNAKDEAIVRLFNEYFNGSMGSIVFQEMRESRALCYASAAYYQQAGRAGEDNWFMTYVITQNDKMKDCMLTFDSICDVMPKSVSAFEQAKTSLLKSIEKRRYVRAAPIGAYLGFVEKGWDHDRFEDIYKEVQKLTLEDVAAFAEAHVAKRTYRYLILGNQKELDMKYLKTRGKIRKFSQKDIFVY
jgi:predicted Zn-dependent peptidase